MTTEAQIHNSMVLKKNNFEFNLITISLLQITFLVAVLSAGLEFFTNLSENAIIAIVGSVMLGFVYSCTHSTQGQSINVINKKTKQNVLTCKHYFIVIPFFSKYYVEKVKDFQLMSIYASKNFSPRGDGNLIMLEIAGDFIVTEPQKFLQEGGRSKFTAKALGELKDVVKRNFPETGMVTDSELEDLSKEARRTVQEKFGIVFHELSSLEATIV